MANLGFRVKTSRPTGGETKTLSASLSGAEYCFPAKLSHGHVAQLAAASEVEWVFMPYTVSEYNHPMPNDFGAEMFPMLTALAAFQDWDAVYQFTYSHSSDELARPHINSCFDLVNHPGQLVWLPIAATILPPIRSCS